MKSRSPRCSRVLAGLVLACLASPAFASDDPSWDWMVAPYVWNAGVTTDLSTGVPPTFGENTTVFDGVLDEIDGVFEFHVEGKGDHFGVMADFTYFGLASATDFRNLQTDTDLDMRLFDTGLTWSPSDTRGRGFDLIGGLRYIDADLSVAFRPYNPARQTATLELAETYTDLLLGARYTWALSDKWLLTARGDFSTGDSDGTLGASIVAQRLTSNGAWQFGYRYFDLSVDTDRLATDVTLSGVVVGYGFRF